MSIDWKRAEAGGERIVRVLLSGGLVYDIIPGTFAYDVYDDMFTFDYSNADTNRREVVVSTSSIVAVERLAAKEAVSA